MSKYLILNEVAEKLGIKISKLETEIGASNGTIRKGIEANADLSTKTIEKIKRKYPEISEKWLLTGEGDMLVSNQTEKISGSDIRKQKAYGTSPDDEQGLIYIPIAAQAGYARNFTDPIYLTQLERLYIPGLPYKGDRYRYFDVEGDSMYPTLGDGMQVIAQLIDQEHWKHLSNFYIHVVVTESQIMVKRLFKYDDTTLVLISDNEEMYPQVTLPLEQIRELWLVKRKLDWEMAPPKNYEIKINH